MKLSSSHRVFHNDFVSSHILRNKQYNTLFPVTKAITGYYRCLLWPLSNLGGDGSTSEVRKIGTIDMVWDELEAERVDAN